MTLQYLKRIIAGDIKTVLANDRELRYGLNTYGGNVTNEGVADALGLKYVDSVTLL
jgi:alanine dehydrogenase